MLREGDVLDLLPRLKRGQKYEISTNSLVVLTSFCCRRGIFISHVPWLGAAIQFLLELIPNSRKFRRYAHERAMSRIKEGSRTKDLFHHLVCSIFR